MKITHFRYWCAINAAFVMLIQITDPFRGACILCLRSKYLE